MAKWLEPTPTDEILDAIQEARAQGRAEILREVAKVANPTSVTGDLVYCDWCDGAWAIGTPHPANRCLWSRAQQAASEER